MRLSYESWLVVAIVLLYFQDSALALRANEAVLVREGGGRWAPRFGTRQWTLLGREIHIPNPFTPDRPLFRLAWTFEEPPANAVALRRVASCPELVWLGRFAWVAWACLFVMVPIGLFSRLGYRVTFAAAAMLYLNNVAALVMVYRWRSRLGVGAKPLRSLAFDCLACAPYSINLVRRVCAAMNVQEDFTEAAGRLLDADTLSFVHAECLKRVDEQIEAAAEDGPWIKTLQSSRERFVPKGGL